MFSQDLGNDWVETWGEGHRELLFPLFNFGREVVFIDGRHTRDILFGKKTKLFTPSVVL